MYSSFRLTCCSNYTHQTVLRNVSRQYQHCRRFTADTCSFEPCICGILVGGCGRQSGSGTGVSSETSPFSVSIFPSTLLHLNSSCGRSPVDPVRGAGALSPSSVCDCMLVPTVLTRAVLGRDAALGKHV